MDTNDTWPTEALETNNAVWNQHVDVLGPVPCGCRTAGPTTPASVLDVLALVVVSRRRK